MTPTLTTHQLGVLHDPQRLQAIKQTGLINSPAEPALDRLTRLASTILGVPTSLISLVDHDRQIIKSCVGLPEPLNQTREIPVFQSICQYVVTTAEPLVIADTRQHPLTAHNTAVHQMKIIAYAGFPLTTSRGQVIGTFCAVDVRPRTWSTRELDILRDLAVSTITEIELRNELEHLAQLEHTLRESNLALERRVAERTAELSLKTAQIEMDQVERNRTQRELHALENQIVHQTLHDPLTHLPNRSLFLDRLHHALIRAQRSHRPPAVLLLDLDRFKMINDSLGHEAGNRLLRIVAERLQASTRPGDTVARIGGDEFTVLLEDITDINQALQIADRIQEKFTRAFVLDQHEFFISASMGVAYYHSQNVPQPEDLVRDAETAMYCAKRSGKARYTLFEPSQNPQAIEQLELETALRRAIENEEFVVHYQPIVALDTGRIAEVEVLVRWNHPREGMLSPARFIPLAEETGLILPIGSWVLETACRQLCRWHTIYPDMAQVGLSVNLSGRQFQSPCLVQDVARVLSLTGFPADRLTLEITESVAMHDAASTIGTLRELKALGVHLAIDDFGTDYSSLAYLKRFPIDVLKIDRSFVSQLGQNLEDAAIVGAIVTLAQTLHFNVTAEGIETVEQLEHLRGLGCQLGQGFLFSRPLASTDTESLLASGRALA